MPKEFYTEKDIEDLFQRGIKSLQITENVVLTELAYEKARRLDFPVCLYRARFQRLIENYHWQCLQQFQYVLFRITA